MAAGLKKRLEEKEVVIGPFVGLNCPDLVEMIGMAGFDFCVIDTEHGPMDPESIQHLVRAAEVAGIAPVARSPRADAVDILKLLDVGAEGVHVPQVNSPETARMVASAGRYHPEGTRGVAIPRALSYGMKPLGPSLALANENVFTAVHCENTQGLSYLEDIAPIDGVDMIFVGPYDLSQSLGVPGEIFHPVMVEAVSRALGVTLDAGKPAGIFVTSTDEALHRIDEGFTYIAYSMDSLIFGQACRDQLQKIRRSLS